ncbi:hypothetical protein [Streptomyces sp. NPDC051452]|uniref:hypothetical protein n=1 Tax=Streptomyces sp. NPDC051452 TaxID=3365654 RepID=UPI0037BB59D0
MRQRGRHAAPRRSGQKARQAVALVFTAGAFLAASQETAVADILDGNPFNGQLNTDQEGQENLDCGNSAHLVRINVAKTANQETVCADTDGHTHRRSGHPGGPQAIGGTALGPQINTAQAGEQNLNCGNSADVITVNVLGTINEQTTCAAVARDHADAQGGFTGRAQALGGTSLGQQLNTAQTGKQNLYCGNSSDTLTINLLGTIRKYTRCVALDKSSRHESAPEHRGHALADAGQVVGVGQNTAQNGRQNQTCGSPGSGIDLPLGETKRDTRCTVYDASGAAR